MAANLNFSQKTIDLLRLAAMPVQSAERWTRYEALNTMYGEKPVQRKLEELAHRDYIEYGVSARTGWLTTKGKAVLAALDAPRDPSSQPYPDGFGNHRVL